MSKQIKANKTNFDDKYKLPNGRIGYKIGKAYDNKINFQCEIKTKFEQIFTIDGDALVTKVDNVKNNF